MDDVESVFDDGCDSEYDVEDDEILTFHLSGLKITTRRIVFPFEHRAND